MNPVFRTRWLLALLCGLFSLTGHAAQSSQSSSLATAQPISQLIADSLLANTPVAVDYLPPRRLPWQRIPSWLRGKATKQPLGQHQALLTVEQLQPEMALYGLLRRENIAVIPVDLTAELTPGGSRLSPKAQGRYFWLHPGNLQLMLNIAAADLGHIWPEHNPVIQANYQQLRKQLLDYQYQLDELLLDAEIEEVVFQQDNLQSLALSLALPVVQQDARVTPAPHQLVIVTATRKTAPAANVWAVDTMTRLDTRSLHQRLTANLSALKQSLQSAR